MHTKSERERLFERPVLKRDNDSKVYILVVEGVKEWLHSFG
jgi:hypothetical protein